MYKTRVSLSQADLPITHSTKCVRSLGTHHVNTEDWGLRLHHSNVALTITNAISDKLSFVSNSQISDLLPISMKRKITCYLLSMVQSQVFPSLPR